MNDSCRDNNWAWRDFWKADRLSSCVPMSSRSAADMAAVWQTVFRKVPNRARILDVATGNGAVLAHAAIVSQQSGKSFKMTGVDLAEIDPHQFVNDPEGHLKNIEFLGGIAAEKLCFDIDSFDCVVSQYGLEYADLAPALTEVGRVLSPRGWLHWLAHMYDSPVVAQNLSQISEVELLLRAGGPLAAMRSFVRSLASEKMLKKALERAHLVVYRARKEASTTGSGQIVKEVCDGLEQVLRRPYVYDPGDLRRMLNQSQASLVAYRGRIEAMVDAALTDERQSLVARCLRAPSWDKFHMSPVMAGKNSSVVGLMISARRTGAD